MGNDNEKGYVPKYIDLDAVLKMMSEKLNLDIDENAKHLVAKFFDNAIEKAAADLALKFK